MEVNPLVNNMENLLGINIDLNEDIKEMINTIKDIFKKKYIDKITNFIENGKNQIKENPSKEISLLQAIKPFIDTNNHSQIDNIIEAMNMMRTVQSFNEKIKNIQIQKNEEQKNDYLNEKNKEVLIKEDGIYEIDEACMREKQQSFFLGNEKGIIFIILILLLTNK
ncbi:hypothetical protein [Defluviitalea phaphyphila]|uniref:hypothetical protein n=1 Tax=Defluviitalea phaphyphila TaxID=1473580 RepID=UPI00073102F0|nr:hypothetical protein [Defluviitalea phaphyphila]